MLDRLRRSAVLIALAATASPVRADYACTQGSRDVTAAERAAMTSVLATVRKALPVAPSGWTIVGDDQFSVQGTICREFEDALWTYGFGRSFARTEGAASRQESAENVTAMAQGQPQHEARLEALSSRQIAILQQQMALNQKGDYAGAERLEVERAKVEKEYQTLLEQSLQPASDAMAQVYRDTEMAVSTRVNGLVDWRSGMQRAPAPAGAQSAYRWTTTSEGVRTGHALVLFGHWTAPGAEGGGPAVVRRAGVPAMAAHGVSVAVSADEDRLPELMKAVDFASLAKVPAAR